MKQSMKHAQSSTRFDGQYDDLPIKKSMDLASNPEYWNEVYEAILTRVLLINDIQDSHSKHF